ncbi:MAG: CNNM domain-containing protein, partial [Candidatus Halalkalibacterium sp. M3_1C_030]
MELYIRLFSGFILLALNAFFVATEFALTRLRQYNRDELDDSAGLNRAWQMTETLEIYLTS